MDNNDNTLIVREQEGEVQPLIESMILNIRGQQVMLDRDLARLYGVETRRLNEQVKRNIDRFPEDFMFQLKKEEVTNLISQNATSRWGGNRKPSYAFTENGIAMLSSVLRSPIAIEANIRIMRAFVAMRRFLSNNAHLFSRIETLEHQQLPLLNRQDKTDRHNAQYPQISVATATNFHDRFLIIDDTVYHIGASLKDLGKKVFGFTLMGFITPQELVSQIR